MLHAWIADLDAYRLIDADIIKDYLIEKALDDGIYDHLLAEILADGNALAPRELSALVHLESVKLADQIRRICITRKENVAIEGTLAWDGQGPRIFRELADSAYTDVEVYGLDIGPAAAHEQALIRRAVYRAILQSQSDDPISEPTATRDLQTLTNHGLLIPHGERRGRYYTAGKEVSEIRRRVVGRRNPRDNSDPFESAEAGVRRSP